METSGVFIFPIPILMGPRSCIFTGKRSKHRLEITGDKHSWTRAVPCSKAYLICREHRFYRTHLLALEQDIIRSFYEFELKVALSGETTVYEDTSLAKSLHRSVLEVIGHEVDRYEALDDRSFEKALEAMMEVRLNSMFTE